MSSSNFELIQGDTFIRTIRYKNSSGVPIDLSGSSIQLDIVPISSSPKLIYSLDDYIFSANPSEGVFQINIPASVTQSFRWKRANYEITITFMDLSVKHILQGTISVQRDL